MKKTIRKIVSYAFATMAGACFLSGVAVLSGGRMYGRI